MFKIAKTIEKDLYQPGIGNWKPGSGCRALLHKAFHRARLREYFENHWRDPNFSANQVSEAPQELRARFHKVQKDMLAISEKQSDTELFQTIFGKEAHDPVTTEAVVTPFGMIFILGWDDYEKIVPDPYSGGMYLCSEHKQSKILPEEYRERVSVLSIDHHHDLRLREPADIFDTARHEYEHMYLAMHEFGSLRKEFSDETLTSVGHASMIQIARLWNGSHVPAGNIFDILGKATALMEWWKEAFLEAVVKDEIIANLAGHTGQVEMGEKISDLINNYAGKFHEEVESFVSYYADRDLGTPGYMNCIVQFAKNWNEMDIRPYQEEQKNLGISAIHILLKAGFPLRVALELVESIPLKDWHNAMPLFLMRG